MFSKRELSVYMLIISLVLIIVLSYLFDSDTLLLIMFMYYSIMFYFYVASKFEFKTEKNKLIYGVIMNRKKMAKIIKADDVDKQVENKEKAEYIDQMEEKKMKEVLKLNNAGTAKTALLSYLFFDLTTADASSICCVPFKLNYYNYLKIDRYAGEYENIIVNNAIYTPGPALSTIYINGSYYCDYTIYCYNSLIKLFYNSIIYIIGLLVVFILIKTIIFSYSMFKNPIETIQTKYTRLSSSSKHSGNVYTELSICPETEVTVTSYKYCSLFRSLFVFAYLLSFMTIYFWIGNLIGNMPTAIAYKLNENSIIKITGPNNTEKQISIIEYELIAHNPTYMLAMASKDIIFDLANDLNDKNTNMNQRYKRSTKCDHISDIKLRNLCEYGTHVNLTTEYGIGSVTVECTAILPNTSVVTTNLIDIFQNNILYSMYDHGKPLMCDIIIEFKSLKLQCFTSRYNVYNFVNQTYNSIYGTFYEPPKKITQIKWCDKHNVRNKRSLSSQSAIDIYDGIFYGETANKSSTVTEDPTPSKTTSQSTTSTTSTTTTVSPPDDYISYEPLLNNLTCIYDEEIYLLSGVIKADCVFSYNISGINMIPKNTNSKVDDRCYTEESIKYARAGCSLCFKNCVNEMCKISINPNKCSSTNITDIINKGDLGIKQDWFNIQGTMARAKRSIKISNPVNTYGEGTYIWQGWKTQFLNANGGVFMAEEDYTDTECLNDETYKGTYQAVCSHKRRQVLSCEPDLYSHYSIDSNVFSCNKPTADELDRMPSWRRRSPAITYQLPEESLAGEMKIKDGTYSFSITDKNGLSKNTGQFSFKTIFAKKYQDNIQQVGNMKYFIYSMLFSINTKIDTTRNEVGFASVWDTLIENHNQWESRVFNNKYHMDRDNKWASPAMGNIPSEFITIKYIERPHEHNYRQDRSFINFVFKSDVYSSDGHLLDPIETTNTFPNNKCNNVNQDTSDTVTIECEYLVPVYFAIRVYGPALLDIKIFGTTIDTIAFGTNICSSVNAFKVGGICYMPDMSSVSTELLVGGYPWTNWSGLFLHERAGHYETPSFYLNHPKTSAGQYMAQVSDSANIGIFSTKGKCVDTYYNGTNLYCDGKQAVNIRLVEYTTFHRPLLSIPNCNIHKNNSFICHISDPTEITTCRHDTADGDNDGHCNTSIYTHYVKPICEGCRFSIKTALTMYQVQRGNDNTRTGVLKHITESYYRCSFCIIIIAVVVGLGYVLLLLHLILCIACYFNSYNMGRIARALKMNFLVGETYTPVCGTCCMYMYNTNEIQKHKILCKENKCPYCICKDSTDELCILSFPSKANFNKHMDLHRAMRRNPYIGSIRIRRNRVVTFMLVQLLVVQASGLLMGERSGMRSNKVGINYTMNPDDFDCSSISCNPNKEMVLNLPLTDSSVFVIKLNKDDQHFTKKYTIKNPRLDTSCVYKYTSSNIITGPKRVVYTCLGKTNCNYNDVNNLLLNPIDGRTGNEFIPIDPYNPLKSYYCPKTLACVSPILEFMWLSAGCFTIDDGTAIGHEYYLPNITGQMMSVFECTVTSINYDMCTDEGCRSVIGAKTEVEDGMVHFEHASTPIPYIFRIGAILKQGNVKPDHLYYNLPDVGDAKGHTMMSYTMSDIPQGETCISGTDYSGGTCNINLNGVAPNMNCIHDNPLVSLNTAMKVYDSLSDMLHCNFENTVLTWNTRIVNREVVVGGKKYADTQTVSNPSINLTSVNCNLGYTKIRMGSGKDITLDVVRYDGKINSVMCLGLYNRNHMTMLSFSLSGQTGMFEFHCPSVFSEVCTFNSEVTNSCNVTTLLPHNSTCNYQGQSVYINCMNLTYYVPDPSSSHSTGITGSNELDTWISGFKLSLGSWWGITLLVIGSILLFILIMWLISVCIEYKKTMSIASTMSNARTHNQNDNEIIPVDIKTYNNHFADRIRQRRTTGAKIVGRELAEIEWK